MPVVRGVRTPNSVQVGEDILEVEDGVGSSAQYATKYIGARMGELRNAYAAVLANTRNIFFGLCGKLTVTTTSTRLPIGGVVAESATSAGPALTVVASDGDLDAAQNQPALIKGRSMYGSFGTSKPLIGVDMYDAATGTEFTPLSFKDAEYRFSNGIKIVGMTKAITSGVTDNTDDAGVAVDSGHYGITSHATGAGTFFYSDGSHWLKQP